MHIIDRRLNPKAKSLGNRQRFVRRAKADIREAVREALKSRKVPDVKSGENIRINAKSVREPSFVLGRGSGHHEYVLPGNRVYRRGDAIPKPKTAGGGSGSRGSPFGEGNDDFVFTLTKDEFLDVFFEDLALPNMIKAKLKGEQAHRPLEPASRSRACRETSTGSGRCATAWRGGSAYNARNARTS